MPVLRVAATKEDLADIIKQGYGGSGWVTAMCNDCWNAEAVLHGDA